MALCRPFFQRLVLHWHAAGLAKWLETSVQQRTRSTTYRMLQKADLSIVLSTFNRADAEKLFAQRILVVNNGIPDPCPEFDHEVLPLRRRQGAARRALFERLSLPPVPAPGGAEPAGVVRVLYLAHCTREKGLFDACEGVLSANRSLRAHGNPAFFKLSVAGMFVRKDEKRAFQSLLKDPQAAREIEYLGFVSGEQKLALLRDSDLFCFPTCYPNENQPVNLIEAMAFGLPILTTRWRSIPELFPRSYPGLVAPNSPGQVAGTLIQLAAQETGETFREMFLANFTLERHLASLARALASIETVRPDPTPDVLAAMGARPAGSPAVPGALP
jgi:glycosyltransferase involved in cell wall biosynthesis